jgi:DNA polymerase III delta prime subunit
LSDEKRFSTPTFSPALTIQDDYLAFWLQNVTMRLRREMCWILQERSLLADPATHSLPTTNLYTNKGISELNEVRYWENKQRFFESDVTAKHLSNLINKEPPIVDDIVRGNLYWIVGKLNLDNASILVLSLVIACHLDTAIGNVISLCLNDPNRTQPTLGLAQKLWDKPEEILFLSDPGNLLFTYGILENTISSGNTNFNNIYEVPIKMQPLVANHIIFPHSKIPSILKSTVLQDDCYSNIDKTEYLASRITNIHRDETVVIPILGSKKSSRIETVAKISSVTRKNVVHFANENHQLFENRNYLTSAMTFCWLRNLDLYLDLGFYSVTKNEGTDGSFVLPLASIPITLFVGISDTKQLSNIPESMKGPIIETPRLSYSERVTYWKKTLDNLDNGIENSILECSRRFRFEREEIENASKTLGGLLRPPNLEDFLSSCWLEVDLQLGELAQKVTPRFTNDDQLILPPKQRIQFQEVMNAMHSVSLVHHQWGMGKAWNESGISVLFAGPSGSGKTMAAEILSKELSLPMYKIDLSQVVNKYIGETEKNLKKLFDKAEVCDMILFFDEADSLFSKRTEVKDAHDRYANLEVNYLLERMERYKGLAILATNRLKDIDEAFLRRLRYIIEFPNIPKEAERKMMWSHCIPKSLDSSEIDIDFLSKQFQLTGGNIRSVVFNACLQSAHDRKYEENNGKLTMKDIIIAVKREYDKLKHTITMEQFGPYKGIVEAIDQE